MRSRGLSRMMACFRLLFLAVGVVVSTPAITSAQERVAGRLLLSDGEYEKYAFSAYAITATGGRLSIAVTSSFDTYLMVIGPDSAIQTNDDAGPDSSDAGLEIENAAIGRWIVIVTSLTEEVEGTFELRVSGGNGITVMPRQVLGERLLANAFTERGISNTSAERSRRLELLKAQLTLAAFRSQLTEKLRVNVAADSDRTLSEARKAYDSLEARGLELEAAARDIQLLTQSRQVVSRLVDAEVRESASALANAAALLEATIRRREANRIALAEMVRLTTLGDELDRLRKEALSGNRRLRERIGIVETEVNKLIEGLASRLLDSQFVEELTFSSASEATGHIVSANANRLRYANRVHYMDAERRLSSRWMRPADFGLARVAYSVASVSTRPRADYSVWLPELFPWPPPEASSKIVLSVDDWAGKGVPLMTLGDVDRALSQALGAAGYSGVSYWGVTNGFALVTPLEQTDGEGVALAGRARWSTKVAEMKSFRLTEYLRALLTAPLGYFRVIVFIVTSESFATSGARAQFSTVELWARGGHVFLPLELRSQRWSSEHRVTALVYEIERGKSADDPRTAVPGRLTARAHLRKSGLVASSK